MSEFFIIEHPRRGTFREMDSDWRAGKSIDIPRFSLTGMRNDPDKAMQFRSLEQAIKMHDRILAADSRPRQNRLNQCQIRRSPNYEWYCRECGGWIDTKFGHQFGHKPDCPMVSS